LEVHDLLIELIKDKREQRKENSKEAFLSRDFLYKILKAFFNTEYTRET